MDAPRRVQFVAIRADAAIHHIGRRHQSAPRLGVTKRLFGQYREGFVVDTYPVSSMRPSWPWLVWSRATSVITPIPEKYA